MEKIEFYECSQCRSQYIQRKWICPKCRSTEFIVVNISGEGKVFSLTRIHVTSEEFSHLTPYTVVLVELSNGLKVTGRIEGSDKVEINDAVTCISNDENSYLFQKTN